ncbi:MAG: glycosyltransferase [Actinomycetota bacterium]|nr:glycosyltransferase [Actinomycetota bacterium]
MRPLRVLTWHVHGSYLYYLAQAPHLFYLPAKPGRPEGYGARSGGFPWPDNVVEVPADDVADLELDCIVFQSRKNYLHDQHEILTPEQRLLPRIYLEHDPPREHPTDTRHPADDPDVLLVHVTAFNDLMWDSGRSPTRVIEHGVLVPEGVTYQGDLDKGIAVVNGLDWRGRRVGSDIFERARAQVPLDLVGMGSEALGGLGEIPLDRLPKFIARYRFFFNPIRYTSLGLAVCEAMMLGMPIVGLATTQMSVTVQNGVSGYVDTDVDELIRRMRELIADPRRARELSEGARAYARNRFNIRRFVSDWNEALAQVTSPVDAVAARR